MPSAGGDEGVPLGRAALAAAAAVLVRLNTDAAYREGVSIQFGETFAEMLAATVAGLVMDVEDKEGGLSTLALAGRGTLAEQLKLRLHAIKGEEERVEEYSTLKSCYEAFLRTVSVTTAIK